MVANSPEPLLPCSHRTQDKGGGGGGGCREDKTAILNMEDEGGSSLTSLIDVPCSLTFSSISCAGGGGRGGGAGFQVQNVSGTSHYGEILAVMGPTGSGKTTLLNAISGRTPLISGTIWLNGEPVTRRLWRSKFAYVLQHDLFFPTLTLRQTLVYTALLRLPDTLSFKDKMEKAEEIIRVLGLHKCQNNPVGDAVVCGLSGGERKRLSIACELITNPSILLIDEPTSGLDSSSAQELIKILKSFAKKTNKNVILTVHQPNSSMYQMFDGLLALSGGVPVYFGPASGISNHLRQLGLPILDHYNPADFLLDSLRHEEKKLVQGWANVMGSRTQITTSVKSPPISPPFSQEFPPKYPRESSPIKSKRRSCQSSFLTQIRVLTRRNVLLSFPRIFSTVNLIQTVVLAGMAGLLWYQTPRTEENLENIKGWMFFSANFWMLFVLFQSLWSFPQEREIIRKERKAGAYRLSAYYVSKILGELPLELGLPTLYFLISYVMIGGTWASILGVLGVQIISNLAAQSVGTCLGSMFSTQVATTSAAIFTVAAQLLGGYLTTNVPSYLRILSLVYNGLRNLEIVETSLGHRVACGEKSSAFQSCLEGAGFIDRNDLLTKDETEFPLWINTVVLLGFVMIFRVAGYLSLKRQLK